MEKNTNKDIVRLMQNVYFGDIKAVERAIALGLNINTVDEEYGNTPLLLAVVTENEEMVDFLLAHGASPDLANPRTGETPLMCAVERDHEQITRLLLYEGCDLYARHKKGVTAFALAKPERLAQLMRAVRRRKAQADVKDVLNTFYCLGVLVADMWRKCFVVRHKQKAQNSGCVNTRGGTV